MSFMPAGFYDDVDEVPRASNSKRNNRVKAVQNTNKMKWKENCLDWILNQEELFALDAIRRMHSNNPRDNITLHNEIKRACEGRNPHELILKFCYNMKETYGVNKLTRVFLDVLRCINDPIISEETKIHAFNLFSQYNRLGIAAAVKAFHLMDMKEKFIKKVIMIADHPWATQAAMVAMEMKLCDDISVNKILFPLFMENKFDVYFEYLDASEKARLEMLNVLDTLMLTDQAFDDYCNKHDIPGPTKPRKQIKTHIAKVRDRYGLGEEITRHTTNFHYTKTLRYVMSEYYDCERISGEIYDDKVVEIASKSVALQKSLVEFTIERGYNADAAKWNDYFELNMDLSTYSQFNLSFQRLGLKPENFYKLSLHPSRIFFVDNEKSFMEMLSDLSIYHIAGLDCEQQLNNDLSILQIAIRNKVYIIDAMNMREEFEWKKLLAAFFNSYHISKLGCGIINDVKTIESFLDIKINRDCRYIDLGQVTERILDTVDFKFPFHEKCDRQPGLAKLTKLCFGKTLDKACAISNWTIRPLREEQLTYAALDAFCAIEIYEKINELLLKHDTSINVIYEKIMQEEEDKIGQKVLKKK